MLINPSFPIREWTLDRRLLTCLELVARLATKQRRWHMARTRKEENMIQMLEGIVANTYGVHGQLRTLHGNVLRDMVMYVVRA